MSILSTHYLGLELENPIIVASSGLTKSADRIEKAADAGAGAVVVKSLFEEVLAQTDYQLGDENLNAHTELYDYMRAELEMQYGPREYCDIIRDAKAKTSIPVIASINCVCDKWWPSFAGQIEAAGADALELNLFSMPTSPDIMPAQMDQLYYDVLDAVRSKISIPIAMKIGPYFSSLPHVAQNLFKKGANALVLFNRFTEPDIDLDTIELKTTFSYSSEAEMHRILRWVALLSGQVNGEYSATTGIKSAQDVAKLLLGGAQTVQIASHFYKKGVESIQPILDELKTWMNDHQFKSIDELRGRLKFKDSDETKAYLRSQFLEKIRGVD